LNSVKSDRHSGVARQRKIPFHAARRARRRRKVVADGKVTLDHSGASERLTEAQQKMMKPTPGRDYRKRTTDEIAPLTLPVR